LDHATLGATVATDPDGGVRVTNILENSDAYRRGLRYSAEILEVDARPVQTANDVQNVLATLPAGWRVKIAFREEGRTTNTLVRLMSVHRPDELLAKMSAALPPPPPRQEPKPEENEERDKKQPDEPKPKIQPRQRRPRSAPKKPPKAVAELLQAREGYANYHFNLIHQEDFIRSLRKQPPGGEADKKVAWVIEGQTAEADPRSVRIRIEPGSAAMVVGDNAIESKSRADLYDAVQAKTIAGVLPALDAWRRMIANGPRRFGETYYLGTMPLAGERPLRNCVVGIDGEMEVRWLYHPETSLVEAVEVFADRDSDPAELWITRDQNNEVPSIIELRYGVESFLKIQVRSWNVEAVDEPNPPKDEDDEVEA
jgi:hypothetical protein